MIANNDDDNGNSNKDFYNAISIGSWYLQKYQSNVLQTRHQRCTSQKKQNDYTCNAIAMTTVLLWYEKTNFKYTVHTGYTLKTLAANNICQFFQLSPSHTIIKCSLYREKHLQVFFQFIVFLFADLNSVMNMTLLKKSVKQFLIRQLIDQPSVSYVVQACRHQEILLMIKFAFLTRRSRIFPKAQVWSYTNSKRERLKKPVITWVNIPDGLVV